MSAARWERLAEQLAQAGVNATVDARSYSEAVRGRIVHGVSRSIMLRRPAGGVVIVADRWWSKNDAVWIGWEVAVEGADSFTVGRPVLTKKRGEVCAAILAALAAEVRA